MDFNTIWCAPKSQVNPKLGLSHSNCGISKLGACSQLPALKGVRGACWKLRDRLRRGTSLLKYMVLHPNPTNKLVRTHFTPFWCWDKPRVTWTHLTHHGSDLGEATTFPHIVFSAALRCTYIQMALFLGTPKVESRNYPSLESRDFGCS